MYLVKLVVFNHEVLFGLFFHALRISGKFEKVRGKRNQHASKSEEKSCQKKIIQFCPRNSSFRQTH